MMKKIIFTLFLVLLFTASVAFADDQADDLADVKAGGVLRMGLSPDYIPFVFYDEDGNMTGIDAALMQEIGRRMGVEVQLTDIAFDGLIDSLNIGQVDVIGGGFSKTDDRQEQIDFTRVYYTGDAEFIALDKMQVPDSVEMTAFRSLKIGVQKGTSFDQWIKTNLVNAGYVGSRNVYVYSDVKAEMNALDHGDVDLVLLDQDVYEDLYRDTGNYKIFYEGFVQENYAFGLRKGSTLTDEINSHLTDMIKDGTAQTIANNFFMMDFDEASAGIVRPSQLPTPTPPVPVVIIPTAAPVTTCTNGMTFVADITIVDGQVMYPGQQFRKTWRVENSGTCTWTYDYSFVYVSGDQMNGRNINIPAVVEPGQTVDLSVDMTAPYSNGSYRGNWQMRSPDGQNFGQTVWVNIQVSDGTEPTVDPGPYIPTPEPTHATGLLVPVNVNSFYPDYYTGYVDQCVNVYWDTTGAQMVNVSVDGASVYSGPMTNGAQQVCGIIGNVGSHTVEIYAYNSTDNAYSSFIYTAQYATGFNPDQPPAEPTHATGFGPVPGGFK